MDNLGESRGASTINLATSSFQYVRHVLIWTCISNREVLQPIAISMPAADDSKRKAARETIDILHEISTLLVMRAMHARKP